MDKPNINDVAGVYIVLNVEVWSDGSNRDLDTLKDILKRVTDVIDEDPMGYIEADGEITESEYDSDIKCFAGMVNVSLTVDQWLKVAENFILDLNDGEVIPDDVEDTLGILDSFGLIPAVSIPGIGEGWGYGGYEPSVMASLYVSVVLNKTGARNQAFDKAIAAICG